MFTRYTLTVLAATFIAACDAGSLLVVIGTGGGGGGGSDGGTDDLMCPIVENGDSRLDDAGSECVIVCHDFYKKCDGACSSVHNPKTGCRFDTCEPCAFDHAVNDCNTQGGCIFTACESGYSDCDHIQSNGCETHTDSDTFNCGACGHVCVANDKVGVCSDGSCI